LLLCILIFQRIRHANDIRPILETVIKKFKDGDADAVDVLYTDYKSSIVQEVTIDRLLPAAYIDDEQEDAEVNLSEAVFEPSPKAVLDAVTERLIESQLNQAFLESSASEQSMRMMAMKSATDNASDLIDDLTLAFNTARQAAITQELAEITGGSEAIK
jgi:F-type H+-transporting ATPase subunit gamma